MIEDLDKCPVCGKPRETLITVNGTEIKVGCICDCKRKEIAEIEKRERQEELDRKRRICFMDTNMANWNFENDDNQNPEISKKMRNYAYNFEEMKQRGEGLLLYGGVGTGKTYYAACIANYLIEHGYTVLMTKINTLVNQLNESFEGRNEFINSLNNYSLIVIDDLGVERNTDYMMENIYTIIDARYRSGLPMIITTNYTEADLNTTGIASVDRINDRILERCFPVKIISASRRKSKMRENFKAVREILDGSQESNI